MLIPTEDRMCSSIREFGFKIPVLAQSDGEVVDGHLRPKAARNLGIDHVPVMLCYEWTPAQVKVFRLLVNRSVTWASWDEELLALELQELSEADFDLDLTGFNPGEIDGLLALPDEERANATPRVPENPVSLPGDLWLCGPHRVLCGDATNPESVARLLGDWQPILMVTDQPYGIELDSEWRDRAGLNGGDFGSKRTLYDEGQKLALDHNTCIQILRDAGHIDPASASCLLDFGHLNAAELEMYLREHDVSSVLDV